MPFVLCSPASTRKEEEKIMSDSIKIFNFDSVAVNAACVHQSHGSYALTSRILPANTQTLILILKRAETSGKTAKTANTSR